DGSCGLLRGGAGCTESTVGGLGAETVGGLETADAEVLDRCAYAFGQRAPEQRTGGREHQEQAQHGGDKARHDHQDGTGGGEAEVAGDGPGVTLPGFLGDGGGTADALHLHGGEDEATEKGEEQQADGPADPQPHDHRHEGKYFNDKVRNCYCCRHTPTLPGQPGVTYRGAHAPWRRSRSHPEWSVRWRK